MTIDANKPKVKLPSFDLSSLDFSDEVKKHIELMLSAITNVSKEYLWYKITSNDEEVEKEQLERVFAYEFYYQWRKLLEAFGCTLFLNGEVSKKVRDEINKKVQYATKYPDIVLHAGQDIKDQNFQLIICEIKRKDGLKNDTVLKDLENIICYLNNDNFDNVAFQCGVFLLIGDSLENSKIQEILRTVTCNTTEILDYSQKILCISYNYIRESGKYDLFFSTLKNLTLNK